MKEGLTEADLVRIINKNFDLRPGCIIRDLGLTDPARVNYMVTSAYGHFGRTEPSFTWEVPKELTL